MKPKSASESWVTRVLRFLRQKRGWVVIVFALLFLALTQTDLFSGFYYVLRQECNVTSVRFQKRGALPPNPNIVLVGIKGTSLNPSSFEKYIGESPTLKMMAENAWPWPRAIFARAIEKIFDAGAKCVAVDVVFAAERDGDDEFAAVLRKYRGRILLASIVQSRLLDTVGNSTQNEGVFLSPNKLFTEAVGPENIGFAMYSPDFDGVIRRFDYRTSMLREADPVHFSDTPDDLDCFAPLAAARYSGKQLRQGYRQLINFYGPWLTYQTIPIEELFIESQWRTSSQIQNGEVFRDKLVFIGPIAEVLHDVQSTPLSISDPGVDIHAQLAGGLLEGRLLYDAPPWLSFSVALLSTFAAVIFVLKIPQPVWQVLAILAAAVVVWYGNQLLFTRALLLVPTMPSLGCLGMTGAFGVIFSFIIERWEKAHTRRVLERSVSKRIAKVMLQNADRFDHARRGERRVVTILFSDIRNFTSWSEAAEPEHLVAQLNEYFERMVDIIERDSSLGNAQKFIGDAILAAWGDTPENRFGDAEDAKRAVTAALKMRVAMAELNVIWAARPDRIPLKFGIGINIGSVVVGEVGHPERGEYTVLGDGVNFAARLESATKQFHTDILVGENVEELTREQFVYRHADFVRVKGKKKPVDVFIPLCEKGGPAPEWLADYHRARQMFLDRKFLAAAALFREIQARIGPEEDFLCTLYRDLCDRYTLQAPPPEWDGSRELTEK